MTLFLCKFRSWDTCCSFSRLLGTFFLFTVCFFKTARKQPLTEDEMTKTACCLQNDTAFSKLVAQPSKPNISIKNLNLCSIENECVFLIYLTMDITVEITVIDINLCNQHFNFCAATSPYWFCFPADNHTIILSSYFGNKLSESKWNQVKSILFIQHILYDVYTQ